MLLYGSHIERCAAHLSEYIGQRVDVRREAVVGGGGINDCHVLETTAGRFFVKTNAADRYPSMFEAEADGLKRLATTGAVRVPEVIAFGEEQDVSYLLLEHIDLGVMSERFWEASGQRLAALHRHTASTFGLDRDNYIGSLKQPNSPAADWPSFFMHQRLEPQLRMARDANRLDAGAAFRFERLFAKLEHLIPKDTPALLHGDLWSGNLLCDRAEQPVLIDPAVHYGHREMDIAMTRLFGGFDARFYSSYHSAYPLMSGWEDRIGLCNLYPLLVHVNLFGGRYAAQVDAVLRRYV